jgi:hypothetical protein
VSPRRGGEADKLGNHYEGTWTVLQLLEVLAGRADSVTVEELGEIGEGVEFTLRRHNGVETHQVKRQHGSANYWTLGALRSEGVLETARRQVTAGRQFHFISTIPAQDLNDLAERARHSPDLQTFVNSLAENKAVKANFDYLSSTVYGSAQVAWETLRGTWARWPGEREVRNWNSALAGLLLTGAPAPAAAVALGDLVIENLAVPLDYQAISDRLGDYELGLAEIVGTPSLARAVGRALTSWKSSIERELLSPPIYRSDADQIANRLVGDERCVFAVGAGGAGKSAVLLGVVERAESEGWAVLAFRLDREEPFSSTAELGQRFGLGISPVSALAAVAQERPSLLVIDQLDAVSKASGRMPLTFDVVADLVREASAFPNMRVLLACRKFDVDNDDRIRTLIQSHQANHSEVRGLSEDQVLAAVEAMGLSSDRLTQQQKELLRLPLHLKLLASIADQAEVFSFATTKDLFDAYWDRKRRDCRERRGSPVRFAEVVSVVADEMSERQRLTVPVSVLDDRDLLDDADVLASEYVLIREGQQIAFFHETFFDYAFARRWTRRGQTLVQFLLAGEQELFRRAQVRQILTYLREESPERFVSEMEALLSEPRVRFHVKEVALALLGALQAPTTAEWQIVERLIGHDLPFAGRLWLALRTLPWFDRLDAEDAIAAWLSGDDEDRQNRALEVMVGGTKERPDRMAQLLAPHAGRVERYPAWLRWVARFADVHDSRALLELLLCAVRRGEYDGHERELSLSVHDLGEKQPEWTVDLLVAHLVERPGALALDSDGRVAALLSRDHGPIRLTIAAAAGAPRRFSEALVPYMLQVMALTAYEPEDGPTVDRHFTHRDLEPPHHQLGEALLVGAVSALRSFVGQDAEAARPLLEQLAADPHETAQWLLYEALTAGGEAYAEYAATLLLDRESGLYAINSSWTVRQLIQAISPHLSAESFARVELAIMESRPGWEGRPPGKFSFTLLSAMHESRLSEAGRHRLGELRRLFNVEQPQEPETVTGGFVGSPIPAEAAQRMNDAQWLRAMDRYDADRTDWTTLTGGAIELAQVLKEEVKKDPARFARLALRLTPENHPAYADATLHALGESEVLVDSTLVFEVIQHIAAFPSDDATRWLGWALRRHLKSEIPDDIIGLLLDRALHSADPSEETWSREAAGGPGGYEGDPLAQGINTTRGQTVEILGDILVYDADGQRTALVVPVLDQLADDPSVAVRACTAHLIAACLRHARVEAVTAFQRLIQTDDRLLTTRHVERLIVYIGNGDATIVEPVIQRMINSTDTVVRQAGGRLAAFAGLELGSTDLFATALASTDASVRKGAAQVCAGRLPHTINAAAAGEATQGFINDADNEVREAAAHVAVVLRGKALRPFERELAVLIGSQSFDRAAPQLLITLDQAPDRVDDLIIAFARRFVTVYGAQTGDISTGAAGEAREVGELLLRAYAQAIDVTARGAGHPRRTARIWGLRRR